MFLLVCLSPLPSILIPPDPSLTNHLGALFSVLCLSARRSPLILCLLSSHLPQLNAKIRFLGVRWGGCRYHAFSDPSVAATSHPWTSFTVWWSPMPRWPSQFRLPSRSISHLRPPQRPPWTSPSRSPMRVPFLNPPRQPR